MGLLTVTGNIDCLKMLGCGFMENAFFPLKTLHVYFMSCHNSLSQLGVVWQYYFYLLMLKHCFLIISFIPFLSLTIVGHV